MLSNKWSGIDPVYTLANAEGVVSSLQDQGPRFNRSRNLPKHKRGEFIGIPEKTPDVFNYSTAVSSGTNKVIHSNFSSKDILKRKREKRPSEHLTEFEKLIQHVGHKPDNPSKHLKESAHSYSMEISPPINALYKPDITPTVTARTVTHNGGILKMDVGLDYKGWSVKNNRWPTEFKEPTTDPIFLSRRTENLGEGILLGAGLLGFLCLFA